MPFHLQHASLHGDVDGFAVYCSDGQGSAMVAGLRAGICDTSAGKDCPPDRASLGLPKDTPCRRL